MKNVFLTLVFSLSSQLLLFGQGTIQSISIQPPSPTVVDTIQVIVGVQFPSSDCELDTSNIGLSGSTFFANAHHCLGMLTAICNTTDTFMLYPPHTAGDYMIDMTLTSGAAPAPCTPGIAIDDHDTLNFTIMDIVGNMEIEGEKFLIYPNPANIFLHVKGKYDFVEIADLNGQLLIRHEDPNELINVMDLQPGFYLCAIGYKKHYKIVRIQIY